MSSSYCAREVRCAGLSSIDPAKTAMPSSSPASATTLSTASKSVASRVKSGSMREESRAVVTTWCPASLSRVAVAWPMSLEAAMRRKFAMPGS